MRALYDASFGCTPIESTGGSLSYPSESDCAAAEERADELFILVKKQLANPTEHYRRIGAVGTVAALRWWSAPFMASRGQPEDMGSGADAGAGAGSSGSTGSTGLIRDEDRASVAAAYRRTLPLKSQTQCALLLLHAMDALKQDAAAMSILLEELRLCSGQECLRQRGSAASDLLAHRTRTLDASRSWWHELFPSVNGGAASHRSSNKAYADTNGDDARSHRESVPSGASGVPGPAWARSNSASSAFELRLGKSIAAMCLPSLPLDMPESYAGDGRHVVEAAFASRADPHVLAASQSSRLADSEAVGGALRSVHSDAAIASGEDLGSTLSPGVNRIVRQVLQHIFVANFIAFDSNESAVHRMFGRLTKRIAASIRPRLWRRLDEVSFFGLDAILPHCEFTVKPARHGVPAALATAPLRPQSQRDSFRLPMLRALVHMSQHYCDGLDDMPRSSVALEACFTPAGVCTGQLGAALALSARSASQTAARLINRINYLRLALQYTVGAYNPSEGAVGLDGEDPSLLQRLADCAELECSLQLIAFAPLLHSLGHWPGEAPHYAGAELLAWIPPTECLGNTVLDLAA